MHDRYRLISFQYIFDTVGWMNAGQEAQPHIPIRDKDAPVCEGDKENNDTSAGAMRKGQKTPGRTIQEPLSGRKRGGEQIARQKLFTGSYFQVPNWSVAIASGLNINIRFWKFWGTVPVAWFDTYYSMNNSSRKPIDSCINSLLAVNLCFFSLSRQG